MAHPEKVAVVAHTDPDTRRNADVANWLKDQAGASAVTLESIIRLTGGAIQENWLICLTMTGGALPGRSELVLRAGSLDGWIPGHGRAEEFVLLRIAKDAGVTVPKPLYLDASGSVLGNPAFVMHRVTGTADAARLTGDALQESHRAALTADIGRELAKIHKVRPPKDELAFLGDAPSRPALRRIEELTGQLDRLPEAWPILEWGLRWLTLNAPAATDAVLCHGDFRTGNIMTHGAKVTGILDWEFASWSDWLEDIGWFCARCWRFGSDLREAGGIGDRTALYQGYEREMGASVDWSAVPYWEIMATVRWAIIAHQQGLRHSSVRGDAMELALTGRKAAEMEHEVLTLIRRFEENG